MSKPSRPNQLRRLQLQRQHAENLGKSLLEKHLEAQTTLLANAANELRKAADKAVKANVIHVDFTPKGKAAVAR